MMKGLIGKHGIRGADSVHLASASWLRTAIRDNVTFVSSDARLLEAAGKEKLLPLDPRTGRLERS